MMSSKQGLGAKATIGGHRTTARSSLNSPGTIDEATFESRGKQYLKEYNVMRDAFLTNVKILYSVWEIPQPQETWNL